MSGSGGGGGGGGGGGTTPCESLKFDAQLTSPQPAIVATLKVGEVLTIVVATMKGTVVVQVLKGSSIAGGLAGPDASRLRNCIDDGHQYEATVISVIGGQVRVHVEHV